MKSQVSKFENLSFPCHVCPSHLIFLGSMACRKGKNWVVLGLISWGFQCGKPNGYGIYTNIPLMKRWIIEMILSYDDKTNSIISIFERITNIAGASAMHFQVPAAKLNKPNV